MPCGAPLRRGARPGGGMSRGPGGRGRVVASGRRGGQAGGPPALGGRIPGRQALRLGAIGAAAVSCGALFTAAGCGTTAKPGSTTGGAKAPWGWA